VSRSALPTTLSPWQFDPVACQQDLASYERLLASNVELTERDHILPFFRAHPDLTALLGTFHPNIITYDRLAVEVRLSGEFVADAMIGDQANNALCLVEFEDGRTNSMFTPRRRQATEWASRFEHGFSQIVDWLWLFDDQSSTLHFEDQFGPRPIDIYALLVVGRDSGVSGIDRRRLQWRRSHVVVNSHHVYCCTFEDLLPRLQKRLDAFTAGATSHPR